MTYPRTALILVLFVSLSFLLTGCVYNQNPELSINGIDYAPQDPSAEFGNVVYVVDYRNNFYPAGWTFDSLNSVEDTFLLDGAPVNIEYSGGNHCVSEGWNRNMAVGFLDPNTFTNPRQIGERNCKVAIILGQNSSPTVRGGHTLRVCSKFRYVAFPFGVNIGYYDREVCKQVDFNYNP